jgi:hypothetical protein
MPFCHNIPIFGITNPGLDSVTGFNEEGSEKSTFAHGALGTRIIKKTTILAVEGTGSTPPTPAKKATHR